MSKAASGRIFDKWLIQEALDLEILKLAESSVPYQEAPVALAADQVDSAKSLGPVDQIGFAILNRARELHTHCFSKDSGPTLAPEGFVVALDATH